MSKKTFTLTEIAQHNTPEDCWVVIDGKVYNVSKFAGLHPGGPGILLSLGGQDVTKQFFALHRENVLQKYKKLQVGCVEGHKEKKNPMYSPVPFAESAFWQGWKSPYYTDSHIKFKKSMREFVDRELRPSAERNDDSGREPPLSIFKKMGQVGILAGRLGPGPHLTGRPVFGVKAEDFDYFHELILHQELSSLGTPGYIDALGCGMVIGLPPVLNFASPQLKAKVVKEVLDGDKRICLAISEPGAGSDVAGLDCTAVKSADGKHYIVNGVKKWITNGNFCDYFTTAVRTGDSKSRLKGLTMLLIERGPGVTTKKIKTSYSPSAGTCLVIFNNVKVPVGNLLGKENQGFKIIVTNFNHERWFIVAQFNRLSRLVVEECFKWAHQRRAFGKRLVDQPVIRAKLANMVSHVESVESWLENTTYQMCNMTYKEQQRHLAGPIALLKLRCTRAAYEVNDDACQVFGGRSITRTGMGSIVEKFTRAVKFGAILGGSEEIMADLGIRQSIANFPKRSRL